MSESTRVGSIDDIPGWFPRLDQRLFEHFLADGELTGAGDLVELGVYLGKSAALIGSYQRPGQTFTVCDLFGSDAGDDDNQRENRRLYASLDRQKFEQNYLALHAELPVIVQDFSSAIVDHVKPGSARFVHVDASHMYDHVAADVNSARTMLLPQGVVVFDDYRTYHTPGVAAAVWEAVLSRGLRPICITEQKLYGTFGDPAPHQERVTQWLTEDGRRWERQVIAGAPIIRPLAAAKKAGPAQPPTQDRVGQLERELAQTRARLRKAEAADRTFAARVERKLRRQAAAVRTWWNQRSSR